MVDPITAGVYATLGGVVVDTYFWVRTTLRLRSFEQELEPRLAVIDAVAENVPGLALVASGSVDPSNGAPVPAPAVERAKNGRPFIRLPGGMARFITEKQARAYAAGKPVALALPPPSQEPPGGPAQPFSPPEGPGLDYAAMAAETGLPEAQIRSFIARHSNGGAPGGGGSGPSPDGAPPAPPVPDSLGRLLNGLVNGNLDREAAAQLARETLARAQMNDAGSTDGTLAGAGGAIW